MDEALTKNERLALVEIEAHLRRVLERKPKTFRDIERELGIPHSSVEVIETRALAKLRKMARGGWAP